MRFRILLSTAMLLCCQMLALSSMGQTITATASSFTTLSGDASIAFVVQNTNTTAIMLDDLSSYRTTGSNGVTYTLWYSTSSLSGTSTISSPTWTQIATATPANVSASAIAPIFSGLSFVIPASTTYRFALMSSGTINYGSAGTNTVTSGGISIFTGNYTISSSNVGYSGSGGALGTTPRYFNGTLVFTSTPCTNPPTPGTANATASTICANSSVRLNLSGHTKGIGQSYQWQRSTTSTGTYSNIGSSSTSPGTDITPNSTYYYRAALTCGTATTYSAPVQVTTTPGLAAGTYTINPSAPASATNFTSIAAASSALSCGIAGPVTFNIASGTYTSQVSLPSIPGLASNSRLTFQSATGNPADVTIQFTSTGTTDNYVLKLDGASYVSVKNITIKNNGTTYARAIEIAGAASNDSIVGCVLTGATTTTNSVNTAKFYGDVLTGTGNVLQGNTVQNGSYGIHISGTSTTNLVDGWVVENNTVSNAYNYSIYLYYTSNLKLRNNTVTTNSATTHYCVYTRYCDNAFEVTGNKITATSAGTKYGLYQYYSDGTTASRGLIANNVILLGNGSNSVDGLYVNYCSFQRYYNNTVNIVSTGAANTAAYFYFSSATTYTDNEIRNNIFSNTGGGYAMFVYNPSLNDNNTWDYNNLYTSGAKLVDQGTPATDYADLTAWRAAFGKDRNSISYDPGFTSTTNLVPDPTKAASWSVNGRGVHLSINNKDINGNTRATTTATGVPDLGAYEFTPTSTPPAATATPSSPSAGTTQYFLFGQDTVASIDWATGSTVPSTVTVRQYTGTIPPQLQTASPNSYMYFYTDINAANGTYDYTPNIYYKDPWLGKVANETNLKLVKKLGTASWVPYNFTESSTNTTRNIITSPNRTTLGLFSGIDNDILFVAKITPSSNFFCPGGSTTLTANQGTGITYKWKLNGNYITGATSMTYVANTAGTYTVEETRGSATVESEEEQISVINPPSASISAPRNVICIGGFETLSANTGTGLSYQWQLNGTDIPSATAATHNADAAGTYTVVVTNPGCGTTSQPIAITAIPLPMATLSPDTMVPLCPGTILTLNASVPPTGLNIGYQWQLNGADIPGANSSTYSTAVGGNYTLMLTSGTCAGTVSAGTNVVNTTAPAPGITSTGFTLSTGVFNSYQWYKDGAPIAGATNFTHTATENGDYTVLVSNGGCTGMSEPFTIRNVGVRDVADKTNSISVYPNPASSIVNIDAPFRVDVVVTTVEGKTVHQGKDVKRVDVSQYPAGVYLMKILDGDGATIKNERIIKADK